MTAQQKKLSILFADISGSTALYEKYGDIEARRLVSRCLTMLVGVVKTYHGSLIKTLGDEIMCTFPSAEAALGAACEMQLAVKTDNLHSSHPLFIRVGFHYGDVLCEENDVYGDAVNVAARVASITRTNQIMTTSTVVDAVSPEMKEKARKIMRAEFKGKQEPFDIFQVSWERDDVESTRIGMPAFRRNSGGGVELTLLYHGLALQVNDLHRSLQIGREASCQLVVKNDFASRQHAHIELRLGKFILADHSSNGTFIRFNSGETVRINREEAVLIGHGTISLGQSYAEDPADLIEFSISTHSA